ncbi:MAG: hypothetical protein HY903_00660 [Deltaproteobacteria bacterium]|nr:hypothetical protein [Deltaproteobacteria bacterium]
MPAVSLALLLFAAAESSPVVGGDDARFAEPPDAISGEREPAPDPTAATEPVAPVSAATTTVSAADLPPAPSVFYTVLLGYRAAPSPAKETTLAAGPLLAASALRAPFYLALRLAMGRAWSANDSWTFSRTGLAATLSAGGWLEVGVGRVFAGVGGGVEVVLEQKARQDSTRLEGLNVGGPRWRWSGGPHLDLEAGASVTFWDGLAVEVATGSAVARHEVAGTRRWRWGLQSRLGLAYAL